MRSARQVRRPGANRFRSLSEQLRGRKAEFSKQSTAKTFIVARRRRFEFKTGLRMIARHE
jgi:hypothetical protein